MGDWLAEFMATEALPPGFADTVRAVANPLARELAAAARASGPGFVAGLCGAQGSGKSTLAAVLAHELGALGLSVAVLSLDDLYLTHAERQALGRQVHPLLATRGVPGTHDVALGVAVLEALGRSGEVALPRFDKGRDDRRPAKTWPRLQAPVDLVLFEGWCVGARPQPEAALEEPVNDLERFDDPDGVWRRYVNSALQGAYQHLFGRLGGLILLQALGFETVLAWRQEQEAKLRARLAAEGASPDRAMDDAAVARFIAHYERLTRWVLAEMPGRADRVIRLDAERRPQL